MLLTNSALVWATTVWKACWDCHQWIYIRLWTELCSHVDWEDNPSISESIHDFNVKIIENVNSYSSKWLIKLLYRIASLHWLLLTWNDRFTTLAHLVVAIQNYITLQAFCICNIHNEIDLKFDFGCLLI